MWAGSRETRRDGAVSQGWQQGGAVTTRGLMGGEGEVTWTQGQRCMHGATDRSCSLWVRDTDSLWQPCRKGLGE